MPRSDKMVKLSTEQMKVLYQMRRLIKQEINTISTVRTTTWEFAENAYKLEKIRNIVSMWIIDGCCKREDVKRLNLMYRIYKPYLKGLES